MIFTALEALLLTAFVSVTLSTIVGMIVHSKSVSPYQCDERRNRLDELFAGLVETTNKLNTSNDIQFRMLRAIVTHLNIPPKEKASILNMGPTEKL